MLIVGYRYAFLRQSFPEFEGTAVEQERSALLLWFRSYSSEWLSGWWA
jgi:hypothetical protein